MMEKAEAGRGLGLSGKVERLIFRSPNRAQPEPISNERGSLFTSSEQAFVRLDTPEFSVKQVFEARGALGFE